jgi:excisionase family DNA binding protein
MSEPLRQERRSHPERRIEHRRKSESAAIASSPPPRAEFDHGPVALSMDRLWTVRQAAAFLGCSTSWVYKAAERGELPRARGLGWGLRFVPVDVHAFARGQQPSNAVRAVRDDGSG